MRAVLGREVLNTVIPYDVTVMDAPHRGKPVVEDSPQSPAARAYSALAEELLADEPVEPPIENLEDTPIPSLSPAPADNADAGSSSELANPQAD